MSKRLKSLSQEDLDQLRRNEKMKEVYPVIVHCNLSGIEKETGLECAVEIKEDNPLACSFNVR